MANKKKKTPPQKALLDRLEKELQTIQQAWQNTKNKIAQTEEAIDNLSNRKSQLEGQASAVKRNIQHLVGNFKDLDLPESVEGRVLKSQSNKEDKKSEK